jgi:hypothetical protein
MELLLAGDPGASAEVIAEWDLWMTTAVACMFSDDFPFTFTETLTETGAAMLTEQELCILGACVDIFLPLAGTGALLEDDAFIFKALSENPTGAAFHAAFLETTNSVRVADIL